MTALEDRTVPDRWMGPEDRGHGADSMICTGRRAQTWHREGRRWGPNVCTGVAMVNENEAEEC